MDAFAINHGDKLFLTRPLAAGNLLAARDHEVWGASGAGVVVATGSAVPPSLVGKSVAIYRSLNRSPETIGLWCERAQVPYTCCVVLPAHVRPRDYCGSLVNIVTAYAFLSDIRAAGHEGVIATAGRSATARALASLARPQNMPVIRIVRSADTGMPDPGHGERMLMSSSDSFDRELAAAATELKTTAVFDGVGGDLLSRIAPGLPMNSTIYVYGFLGGAAPVSLPTALFMGKNLTMRRFSNFESAAVKDPDRLASTLDELAALIDDAAFTTTIGREFPFEQIEQAMAYEAASGAKAVLVPRS